MSTAMNTTTMTLSRALRYKKRVVENIRRLEEDVQSNNCTVDGEERNSDVRLSMNQRASWVTHLVDLKLTIQAATQPINRLVLELAETKAEISFVQRINVTHGLSQSRFRDEASINYKAEIRRPEKDTLVTKLQDRIDDLQTRIDVHNAETTITLSTPDLP